MKKNSQIHIIGLSGAEGTAIAHFLVQKGYDNIIAHDFCTEKDFAKNFRLFHQELSPKETIDLLKKTKKLPIKIYYLDNYLKEIDTAEYIFVPQSWYLYPENKKLHTLKKQGVTMKTMVELYLEYAKSKTVGITGSNGKTTTSNLIYAVLKEYHGKSFLVGNDRQNIQILELVEKLKKDDFLVLEISNRHLKMDFPISPKIAVITNITPNHLSEHKSFADYAKTKLKIYHKQKRADYCVLNFDDPILKKITAKKSPGKLIFFSKESDSVDFFIKDNYVFDKTGPLLDLSTIKLFGPHNRENILAAIAVLRTLKIPLEIIKKVIRNFSGVRKRLEEITEISEVKFINDLSSTTPESTIKALESFPENEITLIIGGDDKSLKMDELAKKINQTVKNVIFHQGTVSENLIPLLDKKIQIKESTSIENTILLAKKISKQKGVVLFSPVGEKFISGVLKYQSLNKLVLKLLSK